MTRLRAYKKCAKDNMTLPLKMLVIVATVMIMTTLATGRSQEKLAAAVPVPFRDVDIQSGFWEQRQQVLVKTAVPHAFEMARGNFEDFAKAAGLMQGKMHGRPWDDSIPYCIMNAAACTLAWHPDPALEKQLDQYIDWINAAMEPDGYIYTARKLLNEKRLEKWAYERWVNMELSHEEFNAAHLIEAACSHYEVTGKTEFLALARRNADLWARLFHPGGLNYLTGHESLKMALVRLYRKTGEDRYLDCAQYLLDNRCAPREKTTSGHHFPESYFQSHLPVRQQREVLGHQVRAMYLYTAMADVAMETGDAGLIEALDALWIDFVSHKMYIHGGSNGAGESFGPPYSLPNDKRAYCESCAAVGTVFWSHRMAMLFRDAKYADVMERALMNNVLAGIALDGQSYNYVNPLEADKDHPANKRFMRRVQWPPLACCPPNVMRLLASLGQYFYATAPESVYVNLYGGVQGTVKVGSISVRMSQETSYPWDGRVSLSVEPSDPSKFAIHIRIPGWAQGRPVPSELYHYEDASPTAWTVSINGQRVDQPMLEKGYVVLQRKWKSGDVVELNLPMPVRRVLASEKVEADHGRVALERGPVVYCAEGVDNVGDINNMVPDSSASWSAEFRGELLDGVTVLRGRDARMSEIASADNSKLILVPYFAWGNRAVSDMAVWLPAELPVVKNAKGGATKAVSAEVSPWLGEGVAEQGKGI